jgi:hypothetical protein
LGSKLKRQALSDLSPFHEANIPLVEAGAK